MSGVEKAEGVDWSIGQVAQITGVPSHRLRRYDRAGLLRPSRIGANGRRYYDATSLVRLQRIVLLRDQGRDLSEIAEALEAQGDVAALEHQLQWLHDEQERIAARTRAVQATLDALHTGAAVPVETMFDGFIPTRPPHEAGKEPVPGCYAQIDRWWPSLDEAAQQAYHQERTAIQAAFEDLLRTGQEPAGAPAQTVTGRLYYWFRLEDADHPTVEELLTVGETYLTELRLTARYSPDSARLAGYIREALRVYAHHHRGSHGRKPPDRP